MTGLCQESRTAKAEARATSPVQPSKAVASADRERADVPARTRG